jgi:hypothetical protein
VPLLLNRIPRSLLRVENQLLKSKLRSVSLWLVPRLFGAVRRLVPRSLFILPHRGSKCRERAPALLNDVQRSRVSFPACKLRGDNCVLKCGNCLRAHYGRSCSPPSGQLFGARCAGEVSLPRRSLIRRFELQRGDNCQILPVRLKDVQRSLRRVERCLPTSEPRCGLCFGGLRVCHGRLCARNGRAWR